MAELPPEGPLPPDLRFLRRLVTILTAVMILGFLVIVALFVIRLGPGAQRAAPAAPAALILPDSIALPEGAQATALTLGPDWLAVVTDAGEILIFDAAGETLRQRIRIETGE